MVSIANPLLPELLQWPPIIFIPEHLVLLLPGSSWVQLEERIVRGTVPPNRSLNPTVRVRFDGSRPRLGLLAFSGKVCLEIQAKVAEVSSGLPEIRQTIL